MMISSSSWSSFIIGAIRQRPLLFNGITGGILCAISDALAQQYEHTSSSSANGNQREQQEQEQYNYYVQQAATKLDDDQESQSKQHQRQQLQQLHHSTPLDYKSVMSKAGTFFGGKLDHHDNNVAVIAQHDDDVALDQIDQQHQHQQQLQQLHHSITLLDTKRVMCAGLIGIFFGGIVYPQAYKVLDTIWKGSSFITLVKKSLFEIVTVGIFVNSMSMTSRGLILFQNDSKHYNLVLQHVVKELPTVTKNDLFVWLPYNMIAFSIIPVIIRPTTTALMEASWQCYISLRSHDYDNNDNDSNSSSSSAPPHNHRNDNNIVSKTASKREGGGCLC